jgi:hypothetical protein
MAEHVIYDRREGPEVVSSYQQAEEGRRTAAEARAAEAALAAAESAELGRTSPGLAAHVGDLHDLGGPQDPSFRGEYTGSE